MKLTPRRKVVVMAVRVTTAMKCSLMQLGHMADPLERIQRTHVSGVIPEVILSVVINQFSLLSLIALMTTWFIPTVHCSPPFTSTPPASHLPDMVVLQSI
jgi:hypothetical protein